MRTTPIGFLFGLAPGGVYPATRVATGAVRSYRTLSPLPGAFQLKRTLGGLLSAALSVGSHLPGVTWHPVLRSPDFPLATAFKTPVASDYLADSGSV